MKKVLAMLLLSCCVAFTCACSFGSNNGSSSNNSSTYKVVVVYDETSVDYTFNDANSIKIKPSYKEGYILNGFYSEQGGGGTKYLNYCGENVTSSWIENSTTTLYPYYEEINYSYVYKSSVSQEEKPTSYSYNVYKEPRCAKWTIKTNANLDYIYNVALNNPFIKIKFTGYADFYGVETVLSIGIGDDMSKGKLAQKTFSKTNSYKTQSVSYEITGKTITENLGNCFIVGLFCNNIWSNGTLKNVYFELSLMQ